MAPIATPASIMKIDHFVDRSVFVSHAGSRCAPGPLPQYRDTRPCAPARRRPGRRQADGWPGYRGKQPTPQPTSAPFHYRFAGRRLHRLLGRTVATQVLASLGADVVKVEGVRRPDGMRFAGGRPPTWDQWWEWGPVFLCSNTNKRGVSIELSLPQGRELALDLIARTDLVVENFSPRVMANFDLEWDAVSAANPQAIMVRMPAFGLDGPWRDRVGFAQTMEQAAGMAWMTGPARRSADHSAWCLRSARRAARGVRGDCGA